MAISSTLKWLGNLAALFAVALPCAVSSANEAIIIYPANNAVPVSAVPGQVVASASKPKFEPLFPDNRVLPINVLSGSAYAIRRFEDTVWSGLNNQLASSGCDTLMQRPMARAELELIVDYLENSGGLKGRKELDPALVLAMFKSGPNTCQFGGQQVGSFLLPIQIGTANVAAVETAARPVAIQPTLLDAPSPADPTPSGIQIIDLYGI